MAHDEHHDFDGITENREQRPPVYFTVLFYGLIVWGVAFSAFYLLSGWSSDAEFQAKMKAHEARQPGASPHRPPRRNRWSSRPSRHRPRHPNRQLLPPPWPPPRQPPPSPTPRRCSTSKCAGCHGADAKGGFGPNLTAKDYEYGKTRQAIFHEHLPGARQRQDAGLRGTAQARGNLRPGRLPADAQV